METFYIILVGMLLCLAVFDLFVGVSNDAVNFLNSAVGSKAFNFKLLMVFAAVGVFVGAAFSSGMMDIARHGIFQPSFYTFAELITMFVAVMVTDVIILDTFNSLGMPTSTTVSMVFELLGASIAMASIKIFTSDIPYTFGQLLNTEKALSVILGIFVSVAIAFTVGTLVQYIARFVFTFAYKKRMKYFVGVFGGFSFASIFYFILIKGIKNTSFTSPELQNFISSNETLLLLAMFGIFFVVSHLLHAIGVNVLKVIIGFGTFSLALAFASNDLVNFVGVPLTGLSSLQHLQADGGAPETYLMGALMQKEPGQWYFLTIAGMIMVVALITSKKAKNVVKTSVALSSQSGTDEIFGTNPVARALVRSVHGVGKFIGNNMPKKLSEVLDKRFNTKELTLEDDEAAFDLLRASVNLMLASSLIALGTSLKLPLSTTYVTFMVAMGTSLADKAWSRETAVYRITGVLSIIGGWFVTAFVALSCCGIITVILHFGGFPVKFILFALVIFLLIRSNFLKKETSKKNVSEERFERIVAASPETNVFPLIQEHSRVEWSEIIRWESTCFKQIINGLLREDLTKLRTARKQIKILKKHVERVRRQGSLCSKKMNQEDLVLKNFFLYQANDFVGDSVFYLEEICVPCKIHVDNNFSPIVNGQKKTLLRLAEDVESILEKTAAMIESGDFTHYEAVRNQIYAAGSKIIASRKAEMIKGGATAHVRSEILYLTILYEAKAFMDSMANLSKASRKFLTEKNSYDTDRTQEDGRLIDTTM